MVFGPVDRVENLHPCRPDGVARVWAGLRAIRGQRSGTVDETVAPTATPMRVHIPSTPGWGVVHRLSTGDPQCPLETAHDPISTGFSPAVETSLHVSDMSVRPGILLDANDPQV